MATKKHHSGLDTGQNSTERLNASRPVAGSIPPQHHFGTPEELGARVGGSFTTLPDNAPTTFRQVGPKAGGNTNDQRPISRGVPFKFADPHRYAGKR